MDAKAVSRSLFFAEREVWWSSLGVNVGVEVDGKNEGFERPILILKKFNGEMVWAAPLTTKKKASIYFQEIVLGERLCWVCLTQIRVLSAKRLRRKPGTVTERDFSTVLGRIASYICNEPRRTAGSSEAEATNESIIYPGNGQSTA